MSKFLVILFVFLSLCIAMNDRYKSKYFKDFSGGEGQKFLSEKSSQYHASSKVQVSRITKKIQLQKDLASTTLAYSMTNKNIASDGSYLYSLLYNTSSGFWVLYRSSDGETWSVRFTFGATYTDNTRIGYYNGILFIFFGGGTGYIATSTDGGGSWTYNASKPIENNQLMVSYWPILSDYLYYEYAGSNGPTIVKTKDFITVQEVYSFGEDVDMEQTIEFDGFIYFVVYNTLYRLEDGKAVKVRSFTGYPLIVPIGKTKMAVFVRGTDYSRTFLFDGDTFDEYARLDGYTTGYPLFEADGFAYFSMVTESTYDIFKIDGDGHLFKEYADAGAILSGLKFKDYDIFMTQYDTVKKSKNYKLAGTIDLPIIDEGDIVPVALIVRHKPLVAGTVVKVYAKKDQNSSWGSALIVSNTTSAVKKEYKYPNGSTRCCFFQAEIELTTNNSANSPEDVSLEFVYLPTGLKNAK